MKRLLAVLSLTLFTALPSPALLAAEAAPILIRFSHVVGEDTPKGRGALLFRKLVDQRLAGKVHVEIYPDSKLFGDADEMAALQNNQAQLLAPSLAKFSQYNPQLQVFDLPFLFDDMAALERFQRRPVGRELLQSMKAHNIVGLGYWHNGMKQMSASKPLRLPADAAGLTFRIQASPVAEAQFAAVRASAVAMPFAEVRNALSSGRVQAAENPWTNLYSKHLDELQPVITETSHGALDYMVVANSRFWYGMPHDIRSELEAILDEVSYAVNTDAEQQNAQARAAILAAGRSQIVTLTADEREAWRQAMRPVWLRFEGQISRKLIEAAERSNHAR